MREMYFCYWRCLWNSLQVLGEKHAITEASIQKASLKNDHNVVPLPDSTSCVDVHGRLRKDVLHTCLYELPHPLCSCILATNKIFGYCQKRKVLQRFTIPEVQWDQTTLTAWWQFYFVFLALHLTASHVLYRVVKSPLMCRKQFTLYQRWRQGAIFWALHFYSSHHIKPGWQQLAGMDCCASVRFQQWYCLLKPLSTSSSMFMSTWLGATCFSENAQISEEYVNRHTFVMQDRFVQLQCHSCWQDGVGSVCFTPDSQTLITTGLRDGSLVCSRLRWAQGSQKTSNGQILL